MQKLKGLAKWLGYLIASVVFTTVFATLIQTQRVINSLDDIGTQIPLSKRLTMSIYDVTHLGTLYGIFIFLAFFTAYIVSGGLYKVLKFGRFPIFMTAGGIAIFVMLMLMKRTFFDIHIIAGARDGFGIFLQCLIGVLGGFIFAVLSTPKPAKIKA